MLKSTALPSQEKGTIFLTLIFGLPVLLVMVGLAVDFGHYYQVKRQAQTAADAGAWGGALQRGRSITGEEADNFKTIKEAALNDVKLNGFIDKSDTEEKNAVVKVNIPPTAENCPPSIATTATGCSDEFVEVIVTQKVPTFFIWRYYSGPLQVKASAIAGAAGIAGPFCFMTLSGNFDKNGAATWNWPDCDIYVKGYINTTGNGSLTANSITCGVTNCATGGWTLTPAARYEPIPPIDPWAERMTKSFMATPGGVCQYVYTFAAPFRVGDTVGSSSNPGIEPLVNNDRKIRLRPGIHCVREFAAWQPDKYIDGTAGVALYVNNPSSTLWLPNNSRLVAMTQEQAASYDPDFKGMALYGTGDFEIQAGGPTVYAYGAFYFPNGSFTVLGNADIRHNSSATPCLQVVAGSINIRDDIFGGTNGASCVEDETTPTTPGIRAIVK